MNRAIPVFFISILFFVSASHAGAATVSELEKVIADLKAQIVELQNKLQANAVSSNSGETKKTEVAQKLIREPAEAPSIEELKPARYGDYSVSVKALQTELAARGYYDGPITGRFAGKTREAVKKFQKDTGIPGDGRVVSLALISKIKDSLCSLSVALPKGEFPKEVIAGTSDVVSLKVTFTAPKNCGVTVKKVTVAIDTNGTLAKNVVENIDLYTDTTVLAHIPDPIWTNSVTIPTLVVAPGASVTLTLKAHVVGVGNGTLRTGLTYIEAEKTGTSLAVGTKRDYFGPVIKVVAPPEEESEETIETSE